MSSIEVQLRVVPNGGATTNRSRGGRANGIRRGRDERTRPFARRDKPNHIDVGRPIALSTRLELGPVVLPSTGVDAVATVDHGRQVLFVPIAVDGGAVNLERTSAREVSAIDLGQSGGGLMTGSVGAQVAGAVNCTAKRNGVRAIGRAGTGTTAAATCLALPGAGVAGLARSARAAAQRAAAAVTWRAAGGAKSGASRWCAAGLARVGARIAGLARGARAAAQRAAAAVTRRAAGGAKLRARLRRTGATFGHRHVGAPGALVPLCRHYLVGPRRTEVPSLVPPSIDVVGEGNRTGASLGRPNTPVLIEGLGTVNGWLLDSLGSPQLVRAPIAREGAPGRCA